MMRMIPTILTLATAVTGVSAQDAEAEDLDRHDIRAIVSALTETSVSFPFTTSPVRPGGAGEAGIRFVWPDEDSQAGAESVIVDLLAFAGGPETEPARGPQSTFASNGWLHVSGGARLRETVAATLADLSRLVQSVEIELSILPPEALAAISSSVLDAGKLDRLLSVAKPLATMRTRVRPGSETLFEAVSRRAYVKDYDTEVAENSKAADPLIDVIPEGTRVVVRVDPTPDGQYVLSARGQQANANGPARSLALNYQTAATLQLPRTWWASTSASARVPDQGALVIGNDVTPRAAWVLRVLAPRSPSPAAPLALVRVGAATRPPLASSVATFRSPMPSGAGGGLFTEAAPDGERRRLDPDVLMKQIRALRPENVPESARRAEHIGPFLALGGDPRYVAAASALAARLTDEVTRGYSVEVRIGTVPAQGFQVPGPTELGTLAPALPNRAITAAIAGDRVVLIGGEVHAYLKDRDVEIAQGMSVDDPLVDVFFTGFSISLQVAAAGEGRCSVDLNLEYQELVELASVATGSKEVAETELPRIAAVVAHVPVDVTLGSWALVHAAPLEGTDRQLVVMILVQQS